MTQETAGSADGIVVPFQVMKGLPGRAKENRPEYVRSQEQRRILTKRAQWAAVCGNKLSRTHSGQVGRRGNKSGAVNSLGIPCMSGF